MFGNKKRDEEEKEVAKVYFFGEKLYFYGDKKQELKTIDNVFVTLFDKLKALEDYLSIEYKEETTKGYVKKNLKAK